jgi:hypothetical protein
VFYINQNVFTPAAGAPLTIQVGYTQFPGSYSLKVYNTAGEFIRDIGLSANPKAPTYLNQPLPVTTYTWDGTNYAGNRVSSGVYIFYLVEPFDRKIKRVILVH